MLAGVFMPDEVEHRTNLVISAAFLWKVGDQWIIWIFDARGLPTVVSTDRSPTADRTLDVREVDGEPFGDIVTALEDLPPDETLLPVNSFEPEPLYSVLEERGFAYETSTPEPELSHGEIRHA